VHFNRVFLCRLTCCLAKLAEYDTSMVKLADRGILALAQSGDCMSCVGNEPGDGVLISQAIHVVDLLLSLTGPAKTV